MTGEIKNYICLKTVYSSFSILVALRKTSTLKQVETNLEFSFRKSEQKYKQKYTGLHAFQEVRNVFYCNAGKRDHVY